MDFIYPEARDGGKLYSPYSHPIIQEAFNVTSFRSKDGYGNCRKMYHLLGPIEFLSTWGRMAFTPEQGREDEHALKLSKNNSQAGRALNPRRDSLSWCLCQNFLFGSGNHIKPTHFGSVHVGTLTISDIWSTLNSFPLIA